MSLYPKGTPPQAKILIHKMVADKIKEVSETVHIQFISMRSVNISTSHKLGVQENAYTQRHGEVSNTWQVNKASYGRMLRLETSAQIKTREAMPFVNVHTYGYGSMHVCICISFLTCCVCLCPLLGVLRFLIVLVKTVVAQVVLPKLNLLIRSIWMTANKFNLWPMKNKWNKVKQKQKHACMQKHICIHLCTYTEV